MGDSRQPGYRTATLAVRAGQHRTAEGEHAEPLFLTSSYVFENAAEGAARFAGDLPGNVYSRYTNPTVRTLEGRLAAMEGGADAVATSSGMAAILSTCLALLKAGDHVICSRDVFGSTTMLLTKYLGKLGIDTTFVGLTDLAAWKSAIRDETRLLFPETPSNPLNEIADMRELASLAHANDAWLVVDNCFCTPALQKPFEFGADLIIHSATKYIDGQGRCLGGAVVGGREEMEEVRGFLRTCGPCMSPFNAWVFLKGLETLSVRMQAHSANALALAQWLEAHPAVEKVFYAGLESHSGHQLASRQQSAFGAVLSFRVRGGRDAAWQVIDSTRLMSLTANLGDAKTTIVHPATTTHGRLTQEERDRAGISDNLVRIAVGLEDIEDLKEDLQPGLESL